MKSKITLAGIMLVTFLTTGCTGFQSFTTAARGGDTVSLTMGWNQDLSKDQLTVTITPSSGGPIVYLPGDPAVRALVNMYPDPLSRLIVERETGDFSDDGFLFSAFMENSITGADKDFSQKLLLLDLPAGIATGSATLSFSSTGGETLSSLAVEILPGTGASHQFQVQEGLTPTLGTQLVLAERAPNYAITFSGSIVPHAIQVDLTHDPDKNNGGVGLPYVVNVRGTDVKTTNWGASNGTDIRVILMPSGAAPLTDLVNFKFYVAGGLQNLQLVPSSVKAFDIDGNEISGVSALLTSNL